MLMSNVDSSTNVTERFTTALKLIKQIKDDMTDKAKRYGIITSLDDCDEDSLFLISYILHMAKENACITP